MTQKIFDTDNAEDMSLLWSILPESCRKITVGKIWDCVWEYSDKFSYRALFKINWHDKTEIPRPIEEATEADLGKLCYFWDDDGEYKGYAILTLKDIAGGKPYYIADGTTTYDHCRRLTKQEIEELI